MKDEMPGIIDIRVNEQMTIRGPSYMIRMRRLNNRQYQRLPYYASYGAKMIWQCYYTLIEVLGAGG